MMEGKFGQMSLKIKTKKLEVILKKALSDLVQNQDLKIKNINLLVQILIQELSEASLKNKETQKLSTDGFGYKKYHNLFEWHVVVNVLKNFEASFEIEITTFFNFIPGYIIKKLDEHNMLFLVLK